MIDFTKPFQMISSISRFAAETEQQAREKLTTPAQVLLDQVQSQLQRPGGETEPVRYGRSPLGRGLRSRPGESPRSRSGKLAASAHIERPDSETQRVIVDAEYSGHLEFG